MVHISGLRFFDGGPTSLAGWWPHDGSMVKNCRQWADQWEVAVGQPLLLTINHGYPLTASISQYPLIVLIDINSNG